MDRLNHHAQESDAYLTPIQLHDPIFDLHDGHVIFPSLLASPSHDSTIHAIGSTYSAAQAVAAPELWLTAPATP